MAVREKLFNNRLKLKVEDNVILDLGKPNWSKVKIIALSDNHMFSSVHLIEETKDKAWDVMTSRLSIEKV